MIVSEPVSLLAELEALLKDSGAAAALAHWEAHLPLPILTVQYDDT